MPLWNSTVRCPADLKHGSLAMKNTVTGFFWKSFVGHFLTPFFLLNVLLFCSLKCGSGWSQRCERLHPRWYYSPVDIGFKRLLLLGSTWVVFLFFVLFFKIKVLAFLVAFLCLLKPPCIAWMTCKLMRLMSLCRPCWISHFSTLHISSCVVFKYKIWHWFD